MIHRKVARMTTAARRRFAALTISIALSLLSAAAAPAATGASGRFLYVAVPGIRNDLRYGGQGLLVFDIDHGHAFVRRVPLSWTDAKGHVLPVKGICASAAAGRLYVSTTNDLTCLDLSTDAVIWKRAYAGGCDRMAIAPDSKTIYLPSFEKTSWKVVDAATGDVLAAVETGQGSHNTVYALDGRHAYLGVLKSKLLTVAETAGNTVEKTVGPFGGNVRPFTVNGRGTLAFVCVNDLLGFEVGDLQSAKVLYRVKVEGFHRGDEKRHGCPSHGIGLTPDEKELWLADSANSRLHVFDMTVMPPRQTLSIPLRDQPGWITFGTDGTFAYPSTGDVVDVKNHQVVTGLKDEGGQAVQSEKLLEVDFEAGKVAAVGNQFGVGRVADR